MGPKSGVSGVSGVDDVSSASGVDGVSGEFSSSGGVFSPPQSDEAFEEAYMLEMSKLERELREAQSEYETLNLKGDILHLAPT